MKNIVLIEPKAKIGNVYSATIMPRLGLPLLGSTLQKEGYNVSIYMDSITKLPWSKILQADLVGISAIICTSNEAYRIGGYLRSFNIPVVIGGIHPTFMPEEALQYADYVVRGEADFTFLPFIKAIEKGVKPLDIPGISYRENGKYIHNPLDHSCPVDVEQIPIPNLNLIDSRKNIRAVPVMTSRGCPHNCTFCSVTNMFGRKYRHRSIDKILEELSLHEGRSVFFCDDNFAADMKHTKTLLREMLRQNIKIKSWGAQLRAEVAKDEEFLDLMHRSGGDMAYIGLESINPETLEEYNKKQSVEDVHECVARFHKYNIRVHGMFVLGSDHDTIESIRDTADFSLKARIDSVQFMMLTPLPGTALFQKLESENRILTRNWELYDGHHAVFHPANMSPEELQNEAFNAYKRFYSLRNVLVNVPLTGWGSAFYRGVGWLLVKQFSRRNRWYNNALIHLKFNDKDSLPSFQDQIKSFLEKEKPYAQKEIGKDLNIFIAEKSGIFYLRLRGFLNQLNIKELNKTINNYLPQDCMHLVINTEGLHFISESSAKLLSRILRRLGKRFLRVQLIYDSSEIKDKFLKKYFLKIPRFELVPGKGDSS